ncbi:FadR/GntR family transcriptional regulator [Rhodococcus opacus]|uniref:FadR/GntR family transcriptional regulator n=1 Tax=Rhodococcus opacus TaxID=37919 RepID=UPI001C45150D|nr:FadR/GntR family transcriptional regulator [Rhodococcus opacus]MBV6756711.1 FadR family transcriptional regulator [Rhodococcus opacus]
MAKDHGQVSHKQIGRQVVRPRQQVEAALRDAILSGVLQSGERLPAESDLATQFRVSRPTIREALSALATQGFIRKTPGAGGGSFVRSIDHEALSELMRESLHNLIRLGRVTFDELSIVRQYLEAPAADLAAQNRTDEDLAELHRLVAEQQRRGVDDPEVSRLDCEFHTAIARISRNRVLTCLVSALHRESEPVSYLNLSKEVGRNGLRQHQEIVAAIEARDGDLARKSMINHLEYLRHHIRSSRA